MKLFFFPPILLITTSILPAASAGKRTKIESGELKTSALAITARIASAVKEIDADLSRFLKEDLDTFLRRSPEEAGARSIEQIGAALKALKARQTERNAERLARLLAAKEEAKALLALLEKEK